MKTEAAVYMVVIIHNITCLFQLVKMDFSLLAYLKITKLNICFSQVNTIILFGNTLVT